MISAEQCRFAQLLPCGSVANFLQLFVSWCLGGQRSFGAFGEFGGKEICVYLFFIAERYEATDAPIFEPF
jgi:hypothetical protein